MANTIPPTTIAYANHLIAALSNEIDKALASRLNLATPEERHWLEHRIKVVNGELKSLVEVL